jgi:hypothetical protein
LLRVACSGNAIGAEVRINGKFKGECPLDIDLKEGSYKLRVLKTLDESYERVFVQDIRIGDGVIKKIEATLSEPRLNAKAQKREDQRLATERADSEKRAKVRRIAAENQRRIDQARQQKALKDAGAGNSEAMVALGDMYSAGDGVEQSDALANEWYEKAKSAGSELAEFKLSRIYKKARKKNVDAIVHMLQLPKPQGRNINVEGAEKLRTLIETDPFFDVPGGNQKDRKHSEIGATVTANTTCSRESRFFKVESVVTNPQFEIKSEIFGALGGLIPLEIEEQAGNFLKIGAKFTRINTLYGQPFPLSAANRFGIEMSGEQKGKDVNYRFNCVIEGEALMATEAQTANKAKPLVCLITANGASNVTLIHRYLWNENSGCFIAVLGESESAPNL